MDRSSPETPRTRRVADRIVHVLAEILARHTEDPRLRQLTVTGARVSRDLGSARVWVTGGFAPADEPKVMAGLLHATPRFRSMLAPELGLRIVPHLSFVIDHTAVSGARIEELLRDLAAARQTAAPSDAEPDAEPDAGPDAESRSAGASDAPDDPNVDPDLDPDSGSDLDSDSDSDSTPTREE